MRTIATLATIALLSLLMGIALANEASRLVTTLIAIPLGSLTGFSATLAVLARLPERQRRRRSIRQTPASASNVIVLQARRAPQLALPAPPLAIAA